MKRSRLRWMRYFWYAMVLAVLGYQEVVKHEIPVAMSSVLLLLGSAHLMAGAEIDRLEAELEQLRSQVKG